MPEGYWAQDKVWLVASRRSLARCLQTQSGPFKKWEPKTQILHFVQNDRRYFFVILSATKDLGLVTWPAIIERMIEFDPLPPDAVWPLSRGGKGLVPLLHAPYLLSAIPSSDKLPAEALRC